MTAPRLEIDLGKIYHNALILVTRLGQLGISVTAVTKATLGIPEIANAWLMAGVGGLGDSRIENIDKMRAANVSSTMTLIRTPMLSQVDRVIASTNISCNTEIDVVSKLSQAAQKADRMHGVILMVELGDLREGIMPDDLENMVSETLRFPNIEFSGIGTNLACRNGVVPDQNNMMELSRLADSIDARFGSTMRIVTGGNSANLKWALSGEGTGRINNLRLGEALLLGREPLFRQPIDGLYTDAITLIAEVIESKDKPSKPRGKIAQSAFGDTIHGRDIGTISQSIFALGRQDTDPTGLEPPPGVRILASSSDHLLVDSCSYRGRMAIGTEIEFKLNYSALLRSMTSPFVVKALKPSLSETASAGAV